ncbi:MAG: ornithine acetyltransferase, partial [Deltaproteobacteria bacterium]|nr:ornithine acetyltransferase [Deltaproteobacteria bacterium]
NDTVLILANGVAGNLPVRKGTREEKSLERVIHRVMKELALKLVEDAEGGTKVAEIRVEGARTSDGAKKIAFSVANSTLVKTAFFGEDPNLGRIMVAIGYAGEPVRLERINVYLDDVRVVRGGIVSPSAERKAAHVMRHPTFRVTIKLGQGNRSASVWTSDLSYQYVRINSAYRT